MCSQQFQRDEFKQSKLVQNSERNKGGKNMDPTTIRIIAGIGAVIVLYIIIWRRKRQASRD